MGKIAMFFLKIPQQTIKPRNSVIVTRFQLIGMQPLRPPKAVEDGHPAVLTRDVMSVKYFSLFSRAVVQVTESSALKDGGNTVLSKRRDKRTQQHRVKSKKI